MPKQKEMTMSTCRAAFGKNGKFIASDSNCFTLDDFCEFDRVVKIYGCTVEEVEIEDVEID